MSTKAKVEYRRFEPGRRILVVSDVHGQLDYLRGLLDKVQFSERDYLIFDGDILEKGPRSLETLRFIMELSRAGNVFTVCGNCDNWSDIYDRGTEGGLFSLPRQEMFEATRAYINEKPQAILHQMCREISFPVTPDMDMEAMAEALRGPFAAEFDFLRAMPTILDTPHYTFVHGGLPEGELSALDAYACMKNDSFLTQGRRFDKWVVVGHWPVVLYGENITCANPVIDRGSRIVSIDGGCVLKDDGQLNALIIPEDGSGDFDFSYYDPFPVCTALDAQAASERSWYLRWGDNRVRVLEQGAEFCLCEHLRTGYRMDILTKYLTPLGDGVFSANDCTDYRLPVAPGDRLSVVERTSRGVLAKKNGVSGWYAGRLEEL